MVGMLFFFIILLMAFALNYRSAENQAAETEAKLTRERDAVSIEKDRLALERDGLASQRDQLALERDRTAAERDEVSAVTDHLMRNNRIRTDMLATVLSLLREREVEVTLDPENGIVRLPESLLFDTGEAVLRPQGVRALRELAAVLALTLPCYSRAPAIQQSDCPVTPRPLLEAVLVEGHTDDRPISTSTFADNWQLASARAINTYKALLAYEPSLSALAERAWRSAARRQQLRGAATGLARAGARGPQAEPAHRSALSDRSTFGGAARRDPPAGARIAAIAGASGGDGADGAAIAAVGSP